MCGGCAVCEEVSATKRCCGHVDQILLFVPKVRLRCWEIVFQEGNYTPRRSMAWTTLDGVSLQIHCKQEFKAKPQLFEDHGRGMSLCLHSLGIDPINTMDRRYRNRFMLFTRDLSLYRYMEEMISFGTGNINIG